MNKPVHYELIGCSGFGRRCLEEYQGMSEAECVDAVAARIAGEETPQAFLTLH